MFLQSYSAVAVFAFAILLNIFYLYSPAESSEDGWLFPTCELCLKSDCHVKRKRPCFTTFDVDFNFTCFTCDPENLNPQFYSYLECLQGCTDMLKTCVCSGACYMCVIKEGSELFDFKDCTVSVKEKKPTCV
ncbi:unnamed protein product [Macrosiphum euphorbiae]|uniref:Uncharacterized protein n=1 Tax=Macrosiphum euphorbiae TaxID=13131 RepID=A0AAV0XKS5_9HEMI|nr:unnamed protein product [Macrosiphum euphorbiae]